MPSRPAHTTTASGWGRGEAPYRLAVRRTGKAVIIIRIRRPVVIVVIGIGAVLIAIAILVAGVIITGGIPGAIEPVTAVAGADSQTIAVAVAIEGPQVRIDPGSGILTHSDHPSTIIRIVEIGIIPAIPHKVAVPAHIRISETQPEGTIAKTKTIPGTTVSIPGIAISIGSAHAG